MRGAEHVARMGARSTQVQKAKGEIPLGRYKYCIDEDNIKMNTQEIQ
jgi:hypothetical protein